MLKYQAVVTGIGPLVTEFIDAGILVFFGADAPPELAEFTIIHDGKELKADLAPGDVIYIDDHQFKVLAVGEVANPNFSALGHLVMKFNDSDTVEMPGDVCVEAKPIPPIVVGSVLRIEQGVVSSL
ncbi:MAG: PTS glucitol/sorbitol transporter subunit IIA [Anaerolineaceae bacterium]|jgi:PTS system glucitol/sorbitol-specific IIA component|nr:PTS glucitol/sorbitol transporter subunit IIA [Anaerolineaceae bacterium]